eukprot:TRINITY_DN28337_c0_g1_i1.p2 TRINITY_DN28337_c0_g1~~TRINITY_DN28337_c0_g1_i1.p2  ORF type:complete len:56 (+),score=1.59 TRINITY_DN28337_c0_g1_i1:20-187(+)
MRRSYFCARAKVLCSDSTPYSRVNSKCGIAPTTSAPKRNASSSNASPLGYDKIPS